MAGTAFNKPGVLIRCVRKHLIDHHLEPQLVGVAYQIAKVVQCAEQRVDVAVVADVIAEVFHRTFEHRRKPHRVCA